ncbi:MULTISPECIES: ABC transporter ATP-binding protein [unclassified Caballeronia]|uniref:ABC transporter ATP-binding protein n=1 Tax=unclassified Caballeronia TaxID=2646786 RepID=UPI001655B298|nr:MULTISPECIES: ABC transporter ATP-binding protein [unclassified Caballeronia]MBC8641322.1 ABC transporter ATP-binding protein [Caballeronia sp. EK]
MIVVSNMSKRYRGSNDEQYVLRDVSLNIPRTAKLAVIGRNGAGKSTLLNLLGGMDRPTRGTVTRQCRVSWPLGLSGGFQGSLSGTQNAKFIARIHGVDEDALRQRIAFIREFSELGDALERPVKSYSSGMRSRLAFAISLAFDFDVYLVDELTAVGDAAFRKKSRDAFRDIAVRAGLIMVSHDEGTLKAFCDTALWLHEGRALWFDDLAEGLARYKESLAA